MNLKEMLSKFTNGLSDRLRARSLSFGLVEVLVSLLITGGIMLTMVTLIMATYQEVRNAEYGDFANNVMLRSLEYVKSPQSVLLYKDDLNSLGVYKLSIDSAAQSVNSSNLIDKVNLTYAGLDATATFTSCDNGSEFWVEINNPNNAMQNFVLCAKVVIYKQEQGLRIVVYSAYKDPSGKLVNSQLVGYRQSTWIRPTLNLSAELPVCTGYDISIPAPTVMRNGSVVNEPPYYSQNLSYNFQIFNTSGFNMTFPYDSLEFPASATNPTLSECTDIANLYYQNATCLIKGPAGTFTWKIKKYILTNAGGNTKLCDFTATPITSTYTVLEYVAPTATITPSPTITPTAAPFTPCGDNDIVALSAAVPDNMIGSTHFFNVETGSGLALGYTPVIYQNGLKISANDLMLKYCIKRFSYFYQQAFSCQIIGAPGAYTWSITTYYLKSASGESYTCTAPEGKYSNTYTIGTPAKPNITIHSYAKRPDSGATVTVNYSLFGYDSTNSHVHMYFHKGINLTEIGSEFYHSTFFRNVIEQEMISGGIPSSPLGQYYLTMEIHTSDPTKEGINPQSGVTKVWSSTSVNAVWN